MMASTAMTADESLARFGLVPSEEDLPQVREILAREAEAECAGSGREDDLALLCCVQLFSHGKEEDILRIWDAKESGFDMASVVDVQFLCGAGLDATKRFLASQHDERAAAALSYIADCEKAGDFDEFSPEAHLQGYREYFGV
jgi:hypothetical protein